MRSRMGDQPAKYFAWIEARGVSDAENYDPGQVYGLYESAGSLEIVTSSEIGIASFTNTVASTVRAKSSDVDAHRTQRIRADAAKPRVGERVRINGAMDDRDPIQLAAKALSIESTG